MAYHLLTGASGLVGRYLVHRFATAGVPVAVVVRPSKLQSAADRVEAIMQHWETVEQRSLPRPIVLEGELTEPDLGLSAVHQKWIARNCQSIVHSAAAMVFRPSERGEPHLTNVKGLNNLLALCRRAGIRQFHHVSTAYICGLRQGRVYENELDMGQQLGNVYEESKIAAEKMLRAADWLDRLTVYRPASVIGDSQTGYTSNFHGFYLPLQLAYSFAGAIPPDEMNERFLRRIGLGGDECKNFVPVDWVASCIAYVVGHPEQHGRTYHLASPKGVKVQLFQSVVQEAVRRYCKRSAAAKASPQEIDVYEKLFHDQLTIYRSHWRDDPVFDLTNTQQALAHMPCPEMDFELLLRVARWAMENNFTTAKSFQAQRSVDVQRLLAKWTAAAEDQGDFDSLDQIDLDITGAGGGQWRLLARGNNLVGAERGLSGKSKSGFHLNVDTLAALTGGRVSLRQSLGSGRLVFEGPRDCHDRSLDILRALVAAN
jgi:thioester reductase-like protein